MKTEIPLSNSIIEAVQAVRRFIAETTGKEPTDEEIAINNLRDHLLKLIATGTKVILE